MFLFYLVIGALQMFFDDDDDDDDVVTVVLLPYHIYQLISYMLR